MRVDGRGDVGRGDVPARCDVAVVGGGPVGVLLAALLADCGVDVCVLERSTEVHPLPRAIAADEVVLRTLEPVVPAAVAAMQPVRDVRLVDAARRDLVRVRLPDDRLLGQPALATFSQPRLEHALRGSLATRPSARLVPGAAVTAVRDDGHSGVDVHLEGGRRVRASFAVACDGATSAVRRSLGVPFRGRTAAERWLVVDLASEVPLRGRAGVTFHCDATRPAVDLPAPGGHRVEGMLHPGEPETVLTAPGAREALLRRVLGADVALDALVVQRSSVYAFHARLAARWRVGRVLLAGDAAHALPPFLGQGLAAGVRDASSLAWRLAEVLQGRADARLLDTWEAERRGHVRSALVRSRALGALVQTGSPSAARARDLLLRTAASSPGLGPWLAAGGPRPPTGTRTPLTAPRRAVAGGQALPSPVVADAAGTVAPLDALLPPGWVLLGLRRDPLAESAAATRALWHGRAAVRVVVPPGHAVPPAGLVDRDGTVVRLLARRHPAAVAVVRPDRLLAGVCAPAELDAVTTALGRRAGWG